MPNYHKKDLIGGVETEPLPIDYSVFSRFFDFREFIKYDNNVKALQKWRVDHKPGIPDLASAVFAQVAYRVRTGTVNEMIDRALQLCHAMLGERGYEETTVNEFDRELNVTPEPENIILVAGCQEPKILESRVNACVGVVRGLTRRHGAIILSGRNPAQAAQGKAQTASEAITMQNMLSSELRKANSQHWDIYIENRSTESQGNIKHALEERCFNTRNPIWLYIVSSTFHVPRLVDIAEGFIRGNSQHDVRRLIAVTAESSSEDEVVFRPPYIKWMMHVVFDQILDKVQEPDFWPSRTRGVDGHSRTSD